MIDDRPFTPSIRLNEWITPTQMKMVKGIASGAQEKATSKAGIWILGSQAALRACNVAQVRYQAHNEKGKEDVCVSQPDID